MRVAFTGHRPNKLGGYGESKIQTFVREQIREELQSLSPSLIISGMALGVDQWACHEALELGIPVLAAVPFEGQERLWPQASQAAYRALLGRCAEVKYVCKPGYAAVKMRLRNEWMVDHSNLLLAVCR